MFAFDRTLIPGLCENFPRMLGKSWLLPRICLPAEQRRPGILSLCGRALQAQLWDEYLGSCCRDGEELTARRGALQWL